MTTYHRITLFVRLALLLALTSAPIASAATVDFDSFADGTFLTTQLQSSGVVFPNGANVITPNPPVQPIAARSAPRAAVAPADGEFARQPFEATFTSGQETVSLWVEGELGAGTAHTAQLVAYNAGGGVLDSATVNWSAGSGWRSLSVSDSSSGSNIRRIRLTGGQTAFPANFLMVDDLAFSAPAPPPPPPTDTTPPTLDIERPVAGTVIDVGFLDVRARATDANLFTVTGSIQHLATATPLAGIDFCGSAVTGVCPSLPGEMLTTRSVSLVPALEGTHRITVVACDAADNCTTRTRDFSRSVPLPPPDVTVEKAEINQGVQSRLADIETLPGPDRTFSSSVRLVRNRDTVLRFFPFAEGRVRAGYGPRMTARITYLDNSMQTVTSPPNAGASTVTVQPRPATSALNNEYVLMRADASRTLNYIIPADRLVDARSVEVRLEEGSSPLTAWLAFGLNPAVRLAVKEVRVFGPGIPTGGTAATPAQIDAAFQYVEKAYPVSEVIRINAGSYPILVDPLCEFFAGPFVPDAQLACASWQFNHLSPPGVVPLTGDRTYTVALGNIPFGSFTRVGINMNRSALATAWGDVGYAHEMGHGAGRPHAGGAHGEGGGEAWPNPHGLVGSRNFGVIVEPTATPGRFDLGQWSLTVVDPCPAPAAQREPNCSTPAEGVGTHDFMSYGNDGTDLGPLNGRARNRQWISDRTWNLIYDRMRRDGEVSSATFSPTGRLIAAAQAAQIEALVVDGIVTPDGSVRLLPVLRRSLPLESLSPEGGPYTLELYDGGGALLVQRQFTPTELEDVGEEPVFLLDQRIPYVAGVAEIRVRHDGTTVAELFASANAPAVEVLAPNGGEVLGSGIHKVTWSVADTDDDPVISTLEYSADGGASWQTLGMVGRAGPFELEINTAELEPSDRGLFRVTATDGVLVSEDRSDCYVGVRVAEAAECAGPPEPPPAACDGGEDTLCLDGGRFHLEVEWRNGSGALESASPVQLTRDTGYFWFFGPENVEVVAKVVAGCAINDRYWVFAAGLTDVEATLRVTDTASGQTKTYTNAQGTPFAPVQDTEAFATCGESAGTATVASAARLESAAGTVLVLGGGRFRVNMEWQSPTGSGQGQALRLTEDTGTFWFFNQENVEAVIKVLDGCSLNDRFWVFAGGLTDVEATLRVVDTETGQVRFYSNAQGTPFAPVQDTDAFATCSP